MKERRWGRIVNISSAAGLTVSKTGIQAYASAKAGVDRVHPADGPRTRAVRHHGQLHRPRLRPLQPDNGAAVGELRRGGPAAAGRRASPPGGWGNRRTSPTACSSSSPSAPAGSPGRSSRLTAAVLSFERRRRRLPARAQRVRGGAERQPGRLRRHDAGRRRVARRAACLRRRPRGRDRRPSRGPGRVARRRRRADHPRLRALRRAAHRRPGRVGHAAVRADRGRRRDPGPGRHRRQGPGLHRAQGRPGLPGPGGPPAAQREVPVRGRGGDRQPAPAVVRARARRGAGGRPRHLRGRGHVAADRAVGVGGLQGPGLDGHRGRGRRHRPAFRPVRRDGGQPAARAQRDPGQPAPPGRDGRGRRLLRRHPRADRRAPPRDRRGPVRRGGVPEPAGAGRGARRGRVQHAGAPLGTADARGQRHGGRREVHGDPARRGGSRVLPPGARPGSRPGDPGHRRSRGSAGRAGRAGRGPRR